MAIDQHAVINLKLRSKTARICANCEHWHPDMWEKWGWCDAALNKGTFHNHRTGDRHCHHSNNRYRSQKGCKERFKWKNAECTPLKETPWTGQATRTAEVGAKM